jgi:hypothetical protein
MMPLGDNDSSPVPIGKGNYLNHQHSGNPEIDSVTPELLNS